jgi:hypothetical protein
MNALPDHLGGYQHLAEDVLTQEGDIYVECGKPYKLVRAFGETVGALEQMHGYNIYRRIPVAKQGDCDTSGWKKVQDTLERQAKAGYTVTTPAAMESSARDMVDALRDQKPGVIVARALGCNALPTDAKARKATPIATGVLDYFPRALAEVARVSLKGNEQHHAGEPLHWDKSKSTDEADALIRHFMERGKIDIDGMRHSAKAAWRSLALLERELDAEGGL